LLEIAPKSIPTQIAPPPERVLSFIDGVTDGKPETNGDSGQWVAYIALAAGNLCHK